MVGRKKGSQGRIMSKTNLNANRTSMHVYRRMARTKRVDQSERLPPAPGDTTQPPVSENGPQPLLLIGPPAQHSEQVESSHPPIKAELNVTWIDSETSSEKAVVSSSENETSKEQSSSKANEEEEEDQDEATEHIPIDSGAIFTSSNAEKAFPTIQKYSLNQERPFAYNSRLKQTFKALKWKHFASTVWDTCTPIVYELYTNALDMQIRGDLIKIQVRGVEVKITPVTIRKVYQLPELSAITLKKKKKEGYPPQKMLEKFVLPRNGWLWKKSGDKPRLLHRRQLTDIARIWHEFICSRIHPTKTLSTLLWERAKILYDIMEHRPVDVGLIIFQQLRLHLGEGRKIAFPGLLTALCRKAGVSMPSTLGWKPSPPLLDDDAFDKFGVDQHPERKRKRATPPPTPVAHTWTPTPPPHIPELRGEGTSTGPAGQATLLERFEAFEVAFQQEKLRARRHARAVQDRLQAIMMWQRIPTDDCAPFPKNDSPSDDDQ